MGFFARVGEIFVGRRRAALSHARRLEAMGGLEEATALYAEHGEPADAARLLALRADAVLDPERKRLLLSQAASFASGERLREIEAKRARLTLELAAAGSYSPSRFELGEIAARLEGVGEAVLAAEVYAFAGDRDAEARMLVEAGAIDRLETVLDSEQARERAERAQRTLHARVRDLLLSGARREALALGRDARGGDPAVAHLLAQVEARRPALPRVGLVVDGERLDVLFGQELTIGRAEASLVIASPALSRKHLSLCRGAEGIEIADLGSRNGTFLAGARLAAPLKLGSGLALELGGEVPIVLQPWRDGVRIETPAGAVHAPLGGLDLEGWMLTSSADGFIELEARTAAVLDGLTVHGAIQLVTGDRLRRIPDGAVALEVLG
jgi:hypothetical protein